MTPLEHQWWKAEPRAPEAEELESRCRHCGLLIRAHSEVKQCPECKLVLHEQCYEDTEGGGAYQTPGCESCRHRCYWR